MKETFFGYVNSIWQALILIEAARQGVLPRIKRRLRETDRRSIKSGIRAHNFNYPTANRRFILTRTSPGAIFVWDEEEAGIIRWTDGLRWSSSKDFGDFVAYVQKEDDNAEEFIPFSELLHKKVLSVVTADKRRFHLASYYTPKDISDGKLPLPPHNLVHIPTDYYSRLRHNRPLELTSRDNPDDSSTSSERQDLDKLQSPINPYNTFYSNDSQPKILDKPKLPPVTTLFQVADGHYRFSNPKPQPTRNSNPIQQPKNDTFIHRKHSLNM
ncbi:hypothetical protein BKA69DRAFT_1090309 [Paraphysoderma sedebokerense]|nr:hypothetical protein BKA69DRAFT_1090309 [Paraphysoderma sedebokerense]